MSKRQTNSCFRPENISVQICFLYIVGLWLFYVHLFTQTLKNKHYKCDMSYFHMLWIDIKHIANHNDVPNQVMVSYCNIVLIVDKVMKRLEDNKK